MMRNANRPWILLGAVGCLSGCTKLLECRDAFFSLPVFSCKIRTLLRITQFLDKERRVLFCHRRDRDLWNLPGGKLEITEAPWEGVVREVKEEVGLTIKPERIIDISSKSLHSEIVFTFLCSVVRGKPTLSDEADEVAFFSLPELPEKISLRQRERVEDFFQNPDGILWRKH